MTSGPGSPPIGAGALPRLTPHGSPNSRDEAEAQLRSVAQRLHFCGSCSSGSSSDSISGSGHGLRSGLSGRPRPGASPARDGVVVGRCYQVTDDQVPVVGGSPQSGSVGGARFRR